MTQIHPPGTSNLSGTDAGKQVGPLDELRDNIAQVFFGPTEAIDRILICLLARGHVLIEDIPGVGKTLLATAIARSIDASFSRVQLTPDMLPSDVLGVSVYSADSEQFIFKPGPINTNILLADEINRTSPRTQSALLEAMSEGRISVDGNTIVLPAPFMVIATQNPQSFEGTFPLPENQLDRFLMRISIGYPSAEAEVQLLESRPLTTRLPELKAVMSAADLAGLQDKADAVEMAPEIRQYIIALAHATRAHNELRLGLSPRGALALASAARATALAASREYCVPEDILAQFAAVAAHRVLPEPGVTRTDLANLLVEIAESVPAPR
jgi:MoxR-like ATPase